MFKRILNHKLKYNSDIINDITLSICQCFPWPDSTELAAHSSSNGGSKDKKLFYIKENFMCACAILTGRL